MKYLRRFNNPTLCDLSIEDIINNYDESIFGPFQTKIDAESFDLNISKSLCLNDEIVGGYLLKRMSMLTTIEYILYWEGEGTYRNLNYFVDDKFISRYDNKKGILSDFIYIKKEYRGNNYAKILIDYSKTLGDYVYGISVPNETEEYWLEKQNRIKIMEYQDDIGKMTLSATKL